MTQKKKKSKSFFTLLIKRIFSIYVLTVFIGTFLVFAPIMLLVVQFKQLRWLSHWLYRLWGLVVLMMWGIYRLPKYLFKKQKKQPYIYCANHTSFVDIPVLYVAVHENLHFLGKSSLKKVPLFGYLYNKLHLLVDRKSSESKKEVVQRAEKALKNGTSLIIFPEGTIPKIGKRPDLIEFKDGAFKLAIETKTPIVPVVLDNNYRILPDDGKWLASIFPATATFYPPIETSDYTLENIHTLKKHVFDIMYAHIEQHKMALSSEKS